MNRYYTNNYSSKHFVLVWSNSLYQKMMSSDSHDHFPNKQMPSLFHYMMLTLSERMYQSF